MDWSMVISRQRDRKVKKDMGTRPENECPMPITDFVVSLPITDFVVSLRAIATY